MPRTSWDRVRLAGGEIGLVRPVSSSNVSERRRRPLACPRPSSWCSKGRHDGAWRRESPTVWRSSTRRVRETTRSLRWPMVVRTSSWCLRIARSPNGSGVRVVMWSDRIGCWRGSIPTCNRAVRSTASRHARISLDGCARAPTLRWNASPTRSASGPPSPSAVTRRVRVPAVLTPAFRTPAACHVRAPPPSGRWRRRWPRSCARLPRGRCPRSEAPRPARRARAATPCRADPPGHDDRG